MTIGMVCVFVAVVLYGAWFIYAAITLCGAVLDKFKRYSARRKQIAAQTKVCDAFVLARRYYPTGPILQKPIETPAERLSFEQWWQSQGLGENNAANNDVVKGMARAAWLAGKYGASE